MLSLTKKLLIFSLGFLVTLPALAQHPDEVAAVRQKLEQERRQAMQARIDPAPKALRLLELGAWQEAKQVLQQAPATTGVRLAKAELAMLENRFTAAEELVRQVLQENPQHREALLLQGRLQVQAWELEKAKATANTLLAKNQKDEAAALMLGRVLMLQKKYGEALEWAKRVQSWNRENAEAWLLESDVHFWNQKPELAEQPLIYSLSLNPFDADARFNYGYAIWRRVDATQLNDMAAQWELALALNPLHYVTHWHWGNGHTNLTYADYAQPEDEQVREELKQADKLLSENKIEEALAAAQQVQQKYKASVLPAMLRGSAYYMAFDMERQARLDSAQAVFQRILQQKKHYGPAHNAMAAVIKQKQLTYLHNYNSLQQVVQQTQIKDPVNFARVFPDVAYYPGDEVQKMVWSQLYESIVYFPFLSKQAETFVVPPLHVDLAIAMKSPYFRQATTFDNRQWMDIRGVGSGAAAIEYVVRGSYLERNVVLHEYVHLFHGRVFTDAENRAVRRLYYNAMEQGRTLDYYSANNEHEYLAQTYPAYFEPVKVHPLNHKSINTTADLKAKDPELYTFLDGLVQRQRAYLAGDKQAMASNWAQVYLNLANKAQRQNELQKAALYLDSALVWDKNYQPALLAYAGVEQQQKKYKEAQAWLGRAKSINPSYAPIYLAEAELQETMKRHGKLNAHDALMSQMALYKKAAELEDDLLMQAQVNERFREFFVDYGMVPEAIAVAEAYVEKAPTVSTYLRDRRDEALAYASWLKGTTSINPEAEQALQRLVSLKPQNYGLRRQYAEVLATQGKYGEAYETLAEAQRILSAAGTPRPDFMTLMAAYQLQLQNKDAARTAAQPLLDGSKTLHQQERHLLVPVLAALGQEEQAKKVLKELPSPETVVERARVQAAKGQKYEAAGKVNRAIDTYERSLLLYPYQLEVRQRLVRLLQQKGRTKEADSVALAGEQLAHS
ncbi:tetratricopeptide repeat protein [Pontibacter litorisediminis]|uniref:tetratricopeptide repeat protein n=1 Tax=Pontibacter litorisediminis TaxID=1846260 RepID=UPI0023EB5E9F|nr:tetratricopeptide repeat protein [Pontibacter litorisediminis]